MNSHLSGKLKTLAAICLFTCLAGVIFQLIKEEQVGYKSILVGLPLGVAFGLLELFVFPRMQFQFHRRSFTRMLVFKTVVYTLIIYTVTIVLVIIVGLSEGTPWSEFIPFLISPEQLILVFYSLVIYGLLVFFLQINHLLGQGILWKFITGKYHKPREEERIFMFLDMKSSTTIAEQLGHVKFYSLMNELFHEISQPVIQTRAEIYQYVGDEVVLTWEMKHGLKNSNCLKTFFLFRESLLKNSASYLKRFGVQPVFKAGLHFGKVVSAQIGDLKREIVYNGDVLNTAARIQAECNKYQRDCIVSGTLMNRLEKVKDFHWERLDTVTLRGKETMVELFSVNRIQP